MNNNSNYAIHHSISDIMNLTNPNNNAKDEITIFDLMDVKGFQAMEMLNIEENIKRMESLNIPHTEIINIVYGAGNEWIPHFNLLGYEEFNKFNLLDSTYCKLYGVLLALSKTIKKRITINKKKLITVTNTVQNGFMTSPTLREILKIKAFLKTYILINDLFKQYDFSKSAYKEIKIKYQKAKFIIYMLLFWFNIFVYIIYIISSQPFN